MKRLIVAAAAATCMALPVVVSSTGAGAEGTQTGSEQQFVVLYAEGASTDAARAAVTASGGTIVHENTEVGLATVQTTNADFGAAVAAQPALDGAARNEVIGAVPENVSAQGQIKKFDPAEDEGEVASSAAPRRAPAAPTAEPLAAKQWDMQQIGATVDGSYRLEQGAGVKVGILDTGVDASHPDIAPNFDAAESRNFTRDLPEDANGNPMDGSCQSDPDHSCDDPPTVDEDGHGTHVASTIAAPINGIGIAGVAPQATIVNLRAGQDSGFFFLQPSVDALTYAGDIGVDVVNMSYYVDPWLFNCKVDEGATPQEQQDQLTIIRAMQRALDYAYRHGVTLVSAAGNGATDYTKTIKDASSPDFAEVPGQDLERARVIEPANCISMPSEGNHVISVSATAPSLRKAYYSDYGNGYVDVAAPGGDAFDTPDNKPAVETRVLAAYPESVGRTDGTIDASGNPTTPLVVKSCDAAGTTCGYYQYLQGTSMASPHAAGVAALIVGKYGHRDRFNGGKTFAPAAVEALMKATATRTDCPEPPTVTYTLVRTTGTTTLTATCEGNRVNNGFYGRGVVSAVRAVGGR
jgi:subtilisin family serine protease